jgi:aryl carrier-like protein
VSLPALAGRWLAVLPAGPADQQVTAAILAAVREHGGEVTEVSVNSGTTHENLADRIRQALTGGETPVAGVLSLLALGDSPAADAIAVTGSLTTILALPRALAAARVRAPIWSLTQGDGQTQAGVRGLAAALARERPQRWAGVIDLPPRLDQDTLTRLCGVLARSMSDEHEFALRPDGLHVRRMTRAAVDLKSGAARWRPGGTVLLTGQGPLLPHIARWLGRHGADHLVVAVPPGDTAARPPGDTAARELRSQIDQSGTSVTFAPCDLLDRDAVAAVVARAGQEHPVTAIIHDATAVADTITGPVSLPHTERYTASTARSVLNLHEATEKLKLSAFAVFSPVGEILGIHGTGNCASGSAMITDLMRRRSAVGKPAMTIGWGLWDEHAGANSSAVDQLFRHGLRAVSARTAAGALGVLEHATDPGSAQWVVMDMEWQRFLPWATTGRTGSLFREIASMPTEIPISEHSFASDATTMPLLAQVSVTEQRNYLLKAVCLNSAAVLGHDSGASIGEHDNLWDIGLSSFAALELSNRLRAIGAEVTPRAIFDNPTPTELVRFALDGRESLDNTK